jgi:hypothetical protein
MNTDELTMLPARPLARAISDDDRIGRPEVQTLTCTGEGCPRQRRPLPAQLAIRYRLIEPDRRGIPRSAGSVTVCPSCAARLWELES